MSELKAPFPYFGGKTKVAAQVWRLLGNPDNYIEPFYGSGAVLLLRPDPPKIETVNDLCCYLTNFWRATQHDPEAVANYADGPVNEVDLHARHRWLVLSEDAKAFRQRMREEPEYFDAKVAGWWCWGLCCWIGSGWCVEPEWEGRGTAHWNQVPGAANTLTGIHAGQLSEQLPRLKAGGGQGVNSGGLSQQVPLIGDAPRGEHHAGHLTQQLPELDHRRGEPRDGGRPQLADAYDIGRGVNSKGDLGTCEARREWILDWFCRLRDRLRNVRVCCGDWSRVCSSESVTTRLGITGVFLDPPYGTKAGRSSKLYSQDSLSVAERVRAWCYERGSNPAMRIVLCGYAGEGHESLEEVGWKVIYWKAQGGYGNRSDTGRANAKKERMWVSPHCIWSKGLFDEEDTQ